MEPINVKLVDYIGKRNIDSMRMSYIGKDLSEFTSEFFDLSRRDVDYSNMSTDKIKLPFWVLMACLEGMEQSTSCPNVYWHGTKYSDPAIMLTSLILTNLAMNKTTWKAPRFIRRKLMGQVMQMSLMDHHDGHLNMFAQDILFNSITARHGVYQVFAGTEESLTTISDCAHRNATTNGRPWYVQGIEVQNLSEMIQYLQQHK